MLINAIGPPKVQIGLVINIIYNISSQLNLLRFMFHKSFNDRMMAVRKSFIVHPGFFSMIFDIRLDFD